ncbi:MAG: hypothetical protein QM784_03965 [Polyangiaceae bacterium]
MSRHFSFRQSSLRFAGFGLSLRPGGALRHAFASALLATLLLPSTVRAERLLDARVQSGAAHDSLSLWDYDLRTAARFELSGDDSIEPTLRGYAFGAEALHGIPGGWRATAAASLTWARHAGPLDLLTSIGLDDVSRFDSTSLFAKFVWSPTATPGLHARVETKTGWRSGWFAHSVRSTILGSALGYSGQRNWAELGGAVEDRRGGNRPSTPVVVDLRPTLFTDLYFWWLHSLSGWLSVGPRMRFTDASRDRHQPTQLINGIPIYTDFPYPTPQDEFSFGGLLALTVGPIRAKASWPFYSTGRYRFEDPVLGNPPIFYRAEHLTVAELSLGADFALGDTVVATVDGALLSRPYLPGAWLTQDAWNQVGITLTFVHTPK